MIGSGLTALVAARTIQQAGRSPVLIWPGLSSLYFVFATIDVLGYSEAASARPVDDPADAVARLIREHPGHPYAKAGLPALEEGMALLMRWFADAGLKWHGSLRANYLLPTAIGAAKPACLAPESLVAGELRSPQPILLCGFEGYNDFVPELAASNLKGGVPAEVRATRVRLPRFEPGRLFTSIDLARSFEDDAFLDEVAGRIKEMALDGATRVGLPAVLGMTDHTSVHARFADAAGHPVFEIPTLPPSVLGLRLFDRLRKHLQEGGVEIIWGSPAHTAELQGPRCSAILLKAAGRDRPIQANAYVLALEDAVDGAMRAGVHRIRDPFFQQTLAETAEPIERSGESLFEPQPFAGAGYRVNQRLQPVDTSGHPLAENVFVAGGAIAGYDPVGTRSRGGVAVATGYRAAKEAMAA